MPWSRDGAALKLVAAVAGLIASACGGGTEPGGNGSGGTGGSGNGNLPAPVLTATSGGMKAIDFSWDPVAGATAYKLMRDPDGTSELERVGEDLDPATTQTRLEMSVHLTNWRDARYTLQACDDSGCTGSEPIAITEHMLDSIGYFKASNADVVDWFGGGLALSGDGKTMAVAARLEDGGVAGIDGDQDDDSAAWSGAVYVFVEAEGTWSQQAYIKASNPDIDDRFGSSIALSYDGNTLAVGAPWEDSASGGIDGDGSNNDAEDSGAVYVFARDDGAWAQQAYVKPLTPGAKEEFSTVALSADGSLLAVGAPGHGNTGNSTFDGTGMVFLFEREDSSWARLTRFTSASVRTGDGFGGTLSLSADGKTLAVSSKGEDSSSTEINDAAPNSGAVYVFSLDGDVWGQTAFIKASNAEEGDNFGASVALNANGTTLAVGASEDSSSAGVEANQDDNSADGAGAAYVFRRGQSSWTQEAYIKATNPDVLDTFTDVTLSGDGDLLVVGARLESSAAMGVDGDQEDNGIEYAGAAYVYTRDVGAWTYRHYLKAPNPGERDFFGAHLSLSADGMRLAIGAVEEDSVATGIGGDQGDDPNGVGEVGAVYLY